jgi:phage tail sheath protein FI
VQIEVDQSNFDGGPLLRIHQALLTMCAARGDLFAVLTVPQQYRETEVLAHAAQLIAGDRRTLSYGALYHPWLTGREEKALDQLRTSPPDGAIAGTFAKRSLLRGAWIAPASEKLHGVVALSPPMNRDYWQALQDAQVNIIRQEPVGFVCLNADTLSLDEDLRPINVRRLLQLLRRAVLKLGANYVFEPNDEPFRRSVQRGFEVLLDGMFLRGAFAGRVASEGFEVVADNSLNTPASVDLGRFIVDIKVAPSLPLTFLTVRLVQAADRTYVTEGQS